MKFTISCLILVVIAGCGSSVKTHEVSGTVTYQNAPLADAQVGFVPTDESGAIKPARGMTDAQGRYTLKTYVSPDEEVSGAMAGSFTVTVEKGFPQNQIVTYEEIAKRQPLSPPKYVNAKESPLKAEVKVGEANTLDFKLED
jgi:hypothetical protein